MRRDVRCRERGQSRREMSEVGGAEESKEGRELSGSGWSEGSVPCRMGQSELSWYDRTRDVGTELIGGV